MKNMSEWNQLDDRAVALARALAMDAVQKVGNGHPGTAMSLAPVAYALFQRHLIHLKSSQHGVKIEEKVKIEDKVKPEVQLIQKTNVKK